jgi:hypothetical protein
MEIAYWIVGGLRPRPSCKPGSRACPSCVHPDHPVRAMPGIAPG